MQAFETVLMTQEAFDALLEYSCSNPTDQTIGKQWKMGWPQGRPPVSWYLCEYIETELPGQIGVLRKVIQICSQKIKI